MYSSRVAIGAAVALLLIVGILLLPSLLREEAERRDAITSPTPTQGGATNTPAQTDATATGVPQATTPQPTPSEPVTLRIITRHPGEIQTEAKRAFLESEIAKRYNVRDIVFYSVDAIAWISSIERRGDIDIAWGGGPTLFDLLFTRGYLLPLEGEPVASAIRQIPDVIAGAPTKRVSDGKIYWVAASVASFGFTINEEVIKRYNVPVPQRWSDLGSPALGRPLAREGKPMVSIADPTQSTSHTRMYQIILQRYGWDLGWVNLSMMAANSLIESGSTEARDNVIQGRVAVAITIDFFGYIAMQSNPATKYIVPPGETIVNGDPIALLKTTKNAEAAKAFIAWVLTEGQKIWLKKEINRLPSNPKVFETPEGRGRPDLLEAFKAMERIEGMKFDDDRALQTERAMQMYFKATLVELNELLKEVWRRALNLYFAGKLSEQQLIELARKMGAPLEYRDPETGMIVRFTEDDAKRVNEIITKDRAKESAFVREWRRAAEERYRGLLAELARIG